MKNKQFEVQGVIGNKIYRYVDRDGNMGSIHFSKNELTPSNLINSPDGKTLINLDGHYFELNNLRELDAIDNALNNPQKSLQKVLNIPSKVIAKSEPDLYKKILFAIRTSVIFNTQPENSGKKHANGAYEELDIVAKKLNKINKEIEKIKIDSVQEKM